MLSACGKGQSDIAEARMLTPALTTLSVSPSEFGERIARALFSAISGISEATPEEFITAKLIKRETTGRAVDTKVFKK